ncbi:MAG TPA: DNRLRE domain-containing protein [Anaerolineales bacterium]|nr:DNRLRE domain-containing protein [Anaerolineales bacterium]
MNHRKSKSFLRRLAVCLLIITMLLLSSCMPPAVEPLEPTETPDIAAAEEIPSSTAEATASVTATSDPSGIPTAVPANETLRFNADADTWVDESEPEENNGDSASLRTDGATDPDIESYMLFTVTGITGGVQSAILRVYAASNDSRDGPAVYMTETSWLEDELTWNNRPARVGGAIDNKDGIRSETWVEYNVTSQVTENGTYAFMLVADSTDGIAFSSLEGDNPPELVITLGEIASIEPAATLPPGAEVLVGAGDIAACEDDQDEMTAQLLDNIDGTVFTTGDNVYSKGTPEEFAECYDPTWGRHKDRTKPIPGSHDYRTEGAAGYYQYFDNFPEYYAYDLGDWRIYALNSEINFSETSEQMAWLQNDLAANPRQCVLAYWHIPRWSSGEEHGRDPRVQILWETLYEAGAEVVINGHEHNYERFAPMDADGEPDPSGTRQFVVGTGGADLYSEFDTPLPTSEVRDASTFGVLKLALYEGGYSWEFVPVVGSTFTDSGSGECH